MFIKTAYEKRLKNELAENSLNKFKLKPKIHKIGSIKNGRVNYDKDEQFFSGDDVPLRAKFIHDEVLQFVDPDILELRKKEWNTSVLVPKNPIWEETFERRLIKIKLGLMDQPTPEEKDKKIEEGCDSRNFYKGWNVSTEQSLRERKNDFLMQTEKGRLNSRLKEEKLLKTYKKPIELQMDLTQKLREEKIKEKEIRDEIRKNYKFENTKASKEKTNAAVFRLNYERKLLKAQIKKDDPDQILGFPDLSKTLKEYKTFKYYHSGKYETRLNQTQKADDIEGSELEKEKTTKQKPISAWSCCRNEDINSEGCHRILVDKYRWNYASPGN